MRINILMFDEIATIVRGLLRALGIVSSGFREAGGGAARVASFDPLPSEILEDAHWEEPPTVSRLSV